MKKTFAQGGDKVLSDHILLKIDRLLVSFVLMCCIEFVIHFIIKRMNMYHTCNALYYEAKEFVSNFIISRMNLYRTCNELMWY
jgi:hypothetical protein